MVNDRLREGDAETARCAIKVRVVQLLFGHKQIYYLEINMFTHIK